MSAQGYKLAIIGSRDFTDWDIFNNALDEHIEEYGIPSGIISGGCKGADKMGAQWARDNSIPLTEFLPDWNRYGRSAAFHSNIDIIEAAQQVIAFRVNMSPGTTDTINKATKKGKDVIIWEIADGN